MEQGIVRSASLLVNFPAREDAIDRLGALRRKPDAPDIGIGLHFNCAAGLPPTACPSLCGSDGRFAWIGTLILRALTRRVDQADVARELDAQLERASELLERVGMQLTHIDS